MNKSSITAAIRGIAKNSNPTPGRVTPKGEGHKVTDDASDIYGKPGSGIHSNPGTTPAATPDKPLIDD